MLKQDIKTPKETDVKYIKKVAPETEKQIAAPNGKSGQGSQRILRERTGCIPVAGD